MELFTSDTLVFAYDVNRMLLGAQFAARRPRQRSRRVGKCTGEHVISLPPRPRARYPVSSARRGDSERPGREDAAARATPAGAAASRLSLPLSPSQRPHHPWLLGGPGRGRGRRRGSSGSGGEFPLPPNVPDCSPSSRQQQGVIPDSSCS